MRAPITSRIRASRASFELNSRGATGFATAIAKATLLAALGRAGRTRLYLKQGDLKWSVINPLDEIRVFDPALREGLQIADAVAGAFYQAVNGNPTRRLSLRPAWHSTCAEASMGYGLKLMPGGYLDRAPAHQRPALDFYAKEKRQAPVP